MKPLTTEEIRAVIARGKLKDNIFKVLGVFCLALAFWEQRVMVFGLFAAIFLIGGLWLVGAVQRQAAQPSKLFRASLSELETDMAQLRRRGKNQSE